MSQLDEELFNAILSELDKNTKAYERGSQKYIPYVDNMDNIFANYNLTKAKFHQMLNDRLNNKPSEAKINASDPAKEMPF